MYLTVSLSIYYGLSFYEYARLIYDVLDNKK